MIFVCSPGRAGSGLIARLAKINGLVASHEGTPDLFRIATLLPEGVFQVGAAQMWRTALRLRGAQLETSHVFSKGFADIILASNPGDAVIFVRRSPFQVAQSLFKLGTIPFRTPKGRKYLARKRFFVVKNSPEDTDGTLCWKYAMDQSIYSQLLIRYCKMNSIRRYEIDFDQLVSNDGQIGLMNWAHSYFNISQYSVTTIESAVNSKSTKKDQGVFNPITKFEICEKRWQHLLNRLSVDVSIEDLNLLN